MGSRCQQWKGCGNQLLSCRASPLPSAHALGRMHASIQSPGRQMVACCRCCLRLLTEAEKEAHKPHPDCSSVDTCAARLCQALAWSAPPITSSCHMSACSVPLRTSTTRLYEYTRLPATLRLYSLLNTRCALSSLHVEEIRLLSTQLGKSQLSPANRAFDQQLHYV